MRTGGFDIAAGAINISRRDKARDVGGSVCCNEPDMAVTGGGAGGADLAAVVAG